MTTATLELTPLAVGTPAPEFTLAASNAQGQVSLADYRGKNLVIVFYPKDQTPGCTKQLCALQADAAEFAKLNTALLGSNPGSLASHERFSEKQGYQFPILVDAEKTMAQAYQALKEGGGIQRTVYIIDTEGVIRYAKQGMPSDAELMKAIQAFS